MVHFDAINVFVCILLIINSAIASNFNISSISELLDQLTDTKNYDRRIRPNFGGEAITVEVSMHVKSISDVSEVQMEFTVDMYFRQYWLDPRLNFDKYENKDVLYPHSVLLGKDDIQLIWVPDTFFSNEKYMSAREIPPHLHNTLIRIERNGRVMLSQRFAVTANCPMNLQLFPMDSQKCNLELESYGHSAADIVYILRNAKGVSSDGSQLAQFMLTNIQTDVKNESLSTGIYQRVIYSFFLGRSLGFYIIQIYLPCIFLVVISWFSFWMSPDLVEGRIGLGVVTVLTITMLILQTNASLPKVSYLKSAELYMGVCFLMVFASCLECTLVAFLIKSPRKDGYEFIENSEEKESNRKRKRCNPAKIIDIVSRILFPVCFVAFNVVYWMISLDLSRKASAL